MYVSERTRSQQVAPLPFWGTAFPFWDCGLPVFVLWPSREGRNLLRPVALYGCGNELILCRKDRKGRKGFASVPPFPPRWAKATERDKGGISLILGAPFVPSTQRGRFFVSGNIKIS